MDQNPVSFLGRLHRQSFGNNRLVRASQECGCFCCLRMFASTKVKAWVDKGATALCPFCGIDSVLAQEAMDRPLTVEILQAMHLEFFIGTSAAGPSKAASKILSIRSPAPRPVGAIPWRRVLPGLDGEAARPPSASDLMFGDLVLPPSQVRARLWSHGPGRHILSAIISGGVVGLGAAWVLQDADLGARVLAVLVASLLAALVIIGVSWLDAHRAMRAIRKGQWRNPVVNRALGMEPEVDLAHPGPRSALAIEARDWARTQRDGLVGSVWDTWQQRWPDVRNQDLRNLIWVARQRCGPTGPYAPGDPL